MPPDVRCVRLESSHKASYTFTPDMLEALVRYGTLVEYTTAVIVRQEWSIMLKAKQLAIYALSENSQAVIAQNASYSVRKWGKCRTLIHL